MKAHNMTLTRLLSSLLAAVFFCVTAAVAADAYPSRPVRLMVPYPAGGLSDAVARLFGTSMSAQLGQPVLVENQGGAGGAIAAQKLLSSPADGHYLFQGTPNELILAPLANASARYRAEDFRLVQLVAHSPIAILTRKDLPVGSVDDLVALARRSSDSGAPLTYGSVGVGSLYHLLAAHLGQRIGASLTHVPYKGGAPLMQDLGGGQVDFAIVAYGPATVAMARQGRLKILASVGGTPPDGAGPLPSVHDSALLKDFEFTIWSAYLVRSSTPDDKVQRLQEVIAAALQEPDLRARLEAQGSALAPPMSLQESAKFLASESARYRALAKSLGLQPQ